MAKRATATGKLSPSPRGSAKLQGDASAATQLGKQLGKKMKELKDQPQMTPQASTPMEMVSDVNEVTHSMIAQRAFEIWKSEGGSAAENWLKAERELRGQNIAAT